MPTDCGSIPGGGKRIFLSSVSFIPAMGPAQCVPRDVSLGIKRHAREAHRSPYLAYSLRMK
jgi:hypothetical protein